MKIQFKHVLTPMLIVALFYVVISMWVIQDAQVDFAMRKGLAAGFVFAVLFTGLSTLFIVRHVIENKYERLNDELRRDYNNMLFKKRETEIENGNLKNEVRKMKIVVDDVTRMKKMIEIANKSSNANSY